MTLRRGARRTVVCQMAGERNGKGHGRLTMVPRATLMLLYALVAVLAATTGLVSSPGVGSVAAADASYPAGQFDAPADGATIVGSVDVSGWGLDAGAPTGTGVDRVQIYLDGALRGTASYRLSRADIAAG